MDVSKAKEEIIKRLGVKESTFYTWLRRYGDVLEREGIVKFAEKGDRKTLIEVDVEKFIEFIKKRSKSPKESFRVEETVIKKVEEYLSKKKGSDIFIIESPKILYDVNKIFSSDFIIIANPKRISPSKLFICEINYSPKAEEFLYFLHKVKDLEGKIPFEIKGYYCIITDKEIDTSMYRILLDLKDKSLDVAVIICKFKDIENLECCAEKFSLVISEKIFSLKPHKDNLEVFNCTERNDQYIDK